MSWFENTEEIRAESIEELLTIAEYCVNTRKTQEKHPKFHGGIYGYSAVSLLLIAIESMGKYLASQNKKTIVQVEKESLPVSKDFVFRVLNSNFFNLGLNKEEIQFLYTEFRNGIIHECIVNHVILSADDRIDAFTFKKVTPENSSAKDIKMILQISVPKLFDITKKAWDSFSKRYFSTAERVDPSNFLFNDPPSLTASGISFLKDED